MPQGGESRVAQQEVEAHGEDPQDQGFGQQAGVVGGQQPDDDSQDDQAQGQPNPGHEVSAARRQVLPNKPRGRRARMMAMGAKMVNMASSGTRALPKVSMRPTTRLPTNAPPMLPRPPMITTTRASSRTSKSAPG